MHHKCAKDREIGTADIAVKRTAREFSNEGIPIEAGARICKSGFTVVERIDLAKLGCLNPRLNLKSRRLQRRGRTGGFGLGRPNLRH